jgi:transcriptional regulator with XRE-family HTH domain
MNTQALVARNLRKLRVQCAVSQENLAVDAGIDRTYVSRLERGLENPTIAVLGRLAEALNVEIPAFFVKPSAGEKPPCPLPGGRRPHRRATRKTLS